MIATPAHFATIAAIAAAVLATTTSACATAPYGSCGSNAGVSCCPDGFYCQPWDAGFFQCIKPPTQCSQQFTNTDFYGNDIKAVFDVQPDVCCDLCTKTPGCTSYTFINSNPGSPACYLKGGAASDRRPLIGAVSGIVNGGTPTTPPTTPPTNPPTTPPTNPPTNPPTTPPTNPPTTPPTNPPTIPSCNTAPFGLCGDSRGSTCCPSGQYCQPWNDNIYQCIAPPAQCGRLLTDTDYYGNDIKSVYLNHPDQCCAECAKTPGCKAYTYINNNPGQPVCYLKSAAGTPMRVVGAVAGQLN